MTKLKKDRHIIFVLGKQRRGKSHLVKNHLIDLMPGPVVVMDPMDEYSGRTFQGFEPFFRSVQESMEIQENKPNVVKILSDSDARLMFRFATVLKLPFTLVVEECDKWSSPHNIDPHFSELVNYGGHYDRSLVCLARRFSRIHKDIESQADFYVSFSQTYKGDLDRVADYAESSDVINVVKGLDRRQFVVFGPDVRAPFSEKGYKKEVVLTLNGNKIKEVKK